MKIDPPLYLPTVGWIRKMSIDVVEYRYAVFLTLVDRVEGIDSGFVDAGTYTFFADSEERLVTALVYSLRFRGYNLHTLAWESNLYPQRIARTSVRGISTGMLVGFQGFRFQYERTEDGLAMRHVSTLVRIDGDYVRADSVDCRALYRKWNSQLRNMRRCGVGLSNAKLDFIGERLTVAPVARAVKWRLP